MPSTILAPGAWRQEDADALLLATRCGRCSAETFPPAAACPTCWERQDVTTVELPRHGTVHAFAVTHIAAEGIAAPYAVAFVDLANGIRICGRLRAWDHVRIGDRVTIVSGVLRNTADHELHGWMFQPAIVHLDEER